MGRASPTAPADDAFASSPNTFKLTVSARILLGSVLRAALRRWCQKYSCGQAKWPAKAPRALSAAASELPAAGVQAAFKGSYLLDQGDGAGLCPYRDIQHRFHLAPAPDGQTVLVAARGSTEFGYFISAGALASVDGGGIQLTLARRYLEDDDPRAKWSSPARVVEELLRKEPTGGPPWHEDEDESLRVLMSEYAGLETSRVPWVHIAMQLGQTGLGPPRNGKQCRARWTQHLDPSIKKVEWQGFASPWRARAMRLRHTP